MARVIKPNKKKHGDSVFVMRGDYFSDKAGGGGEFGLVGGGYGFTPYLRVRPDTFAGIATISGERSLRILARAILKEVGRG